jgi:hypothetical protein
METNKIIAEFMQADVNSNGTFELPQHGTLRPNGEFKTEFSISQLKYHSDWNWLMPVVEKIDSIGHEVRIGGGVVEIFDVQGNVLIREEGINHQEVVYQAIVRFVSEIRD